MRAQNIALLGALSPAREVRIANEADWASGRPMRL
jgi:hypothetical protein